MDKQTLETLTLTTIEVSIGKKKEQWEIVHNLPEVFGLSLMNAFESWSVRTETPTIASFLDYVNGKNTGYVCMSKKQYDLIK